MAERKLKICSLKPNPLQKSTFEACSEGEDDFLRADLEENGQRDPIVVRPLPKSKKFEILDGHRRVEQLRALGHDKVRAIVRDDLVDVDPAEKEKIFRSYNVNRRQLTRLAKARHVLRCFEIDHGLEPGGLRLSKHEKEAKARVGKLLEISGRHLNRLFRILLLPVPIQKAVENNLLRQTRAEKIEALSVGTQREIAQRIDGLEDKSAIAEIVDEYLTSPVRTRNGIKQSLDRLVRALRDARIALGDQVPDLTHPSWQEWLPDLEREKLFLHELVDQLKSIDPESDPLAELAQTLDQTQE